MIAFKMLAVAACLIGSTMQPSRPASEDRVLEASREVLYQRIRTAKLRYSDTSRYVEIAPVMKYHDIKVALYASRAMRTHTVGGFSEPLAYTYYSFVPLGETREKFKAESAKKAAGAACDEKFLADYLQLFHPEVAEFWKVGTAVRKFLASSVHKGAGYDFASYLIAPTPEGDVVVVLYDKANLRRVSASRARAR